MNARDLGNDNPRRDGGSGGIDYGGSAREAETVEIPSGYVAQRNPLPLAQLRKVVNGSTTNGKWADAALIFGSILFGLMLIINLASTLAVNARANRLVEAEETRAREGPIVVDRLEGKLDGVVEDVAEIKRVVTSTTTTTTPRRTPSTGTTVRPRSTTTTRPPTTTTTVPSPPRTSPPTTRPCLLALGDLCLL